MKGVILAGGKATRLRPLTLVTNKHLLPVYNKPMIYYSIESMVQAGITEILVIVSPTHAGSFLNLLSSGKEFGVKFTYEIQENAHGIADAISVAKDFADKESILVILGDNIFKYDLSNSVKRFDAEKSNAKIFGVMHKHPEHYGVIELKGNRVVSLEEKPSTPKSKIIAIGVYMYDSNVFSHIETLIPSLRGELEVTDLNNIYLSKGVLECDVIDDVWIDAGTSPEELLRAGQLAHKLFS